MITKNERYKKAIPEAIIHTSSELVSVAVLFSRDSILYAAEGNYMNPHQKIMSARIQASFAMLQ